jgi:histidyl-tRNA synthetase
MTKFLAPKGVSEYFPPRSDLFEIVRDRLISPAKRAGYSLMELPVFEDTALFERGVGESTDVVSKEMYTFEDRGGRSITLRPEGTAGAMRSVIENNLDKGQLPVKIFYSGPFFRAERPQAGRYRQFYQVGIEAIGYSDPEIDAEVIWIADSGFKSLSLSKYELQITSLGDETSRADHRVELIKFLNKLPLDEETSQRAKINPLRLFDDKRPEIIDAMQDAPLLINYLNKESADHFEKVKKILSALDISFTINPKMVRGLDYYTGTTFEFVHPMLGSQSGIGGGGRYDGLMSQLGGSDLSGIGFGIGVDRVLMACEAEKSISDLVKAMDLFIVPIGEIAKEYSTRLVRDLRELGFSSDIAYGDRGLKGGMKAADKSGAVFALVIGDDEITSKTGNLKNMSTGENISSTLTPSALASFLANFAQDL